VTSGRQATCSSGDDGGNPWWGWPSCEATDHRQTQLAFQVRWTWQVMFDLPQNMTDSFDDRSCLARDGIEPSKLQSHCEINPGFNRAILRMNWNGHFSLEWKEFETKHFASHPPACQRLQNNGQNFDTVPFLLLESGVRARLERCKRWWKTPDLHILRWKRCQDHRGGICFPWSGSGSMV
jgi:hypothetical protein